MNKVRIGFVGAGRNTREKHLPKLQALAGVELVSVANRSLSSAREVAEQWGIPKVYEHWWELVRADEIDAVVIGTWPNMHARVTEVALESGKHVMCEARMARNVAEAKVMLRAAQKQPQLVTQLVPSPFTLPVDNTVKRLIAEGFVGEVLALEVTEKGAFADFSSPLTWRQDRNLSGVNTMSLGIWYEALMRWVGEASHVMAMGKTFVRARPDGNGKVRFTDVPDHLDIVAEMVCGAQLHIGLSQVSGFAPGVTLAIYGSEGTLQFTGGQLYGGQRKSTKLEAVAVPANEAGSWRVETEFVEAIRGVKPISHTTFADGLKYMTFTEAVWRSVAEKRGVYLTEFA